MFNEIRKDLFEVDDSYALAHCIAEDAAMGAGIALEFARRFPIMTSHLRKSFLGTGSSILFAKGDNQSHHVINLITKEKSWHKPTYDAFTIAVFSMRKQAEKYGISKIAMPRIGCGLDGLNWDRCREIILEEFKDTNIEILVCYL